MAAQLEGNGRPAGGWAVKLLAMGMIIKGEKMKSQWGEISTQPRQDPGSGLFAVLQLGSAATIKRNPSLG